MFCLDDAVRYFLCPGKTDMRKGINSLCRVVHGRMGQAISYAYPLWPRMKACLKDGNIKIDNNLAENAICPLTLSRKNFLFCGNHEAAENTAVICSLLATCKAQEVNPREWLNDAIARLSYYQGKDSGKNIRELFLDV